MLSLGYDTVLIRNTEILKKRSSEKQFVPDRERTLPVTSFNLWTNMFQISDEMSITGLNSSICAERMLLQITSGCFTDKHICKS